MHSRSRAIWLGLVLAVLAAGGCHRKYAYTSVPTGAMAPTIQPGSVVTVDFNAYKNGKPVKRWDVIALKSKYTIVVKRVIGLPGETIQLSPDGKTLLVNGKAQPVPRQVPWRGHPLVRRATANYPIVGRDQKVGKGELYVLGDNLLVSRDSRDVGPVKRSQVTGKVVFKTGQ